MGTIGVSAWINRANENLLEILYYISQIISALFVVVGTAIAVIQYIFNSNTARNEADKQRKVEAAKMADEFRRNVIPMINDLSVAYSDDKLRKEIIDYLDNSNLERFDREEVRRLFPKDACLQYKIQIAQNYLMKTSNEYKQLVEQQKRSNELSEEEKTTIEVKLRNMVWDAYRKVSEMSTDLSNSLEYMCICFNTNIADDETVYQSLHNVFFLAVHMIYIFTFEANTNEHDRLFYNVMILYKKWKKLNLEKREEEERNKAKLEKELDALKARYSDNITVKTKCE